MLHFGLVRQAFVKQKLRWLQALVVIELVVTAGLLLWMGQRGIVIDEIGIAFGVGFFLIVGVPVSIIGLRKVQHRQADT